LGAKMEFSYIYTDKSMDDLINVEDTPLVLDTAVPAKTEEKKQENDLIDDLLYKAEMEEKNERSSDNNFDGMNDKDNLSVSEKKFDNPSTSSIQNKKSDSGINPADVHDDPVLDW